MSTQELLNAIQGNEDTQEVSLILEGGFTRTYILAADETEVWGRDPEDNILDTTRARFVEQYPEATWEL